MGDKVLKISILASLVIAGLCSFHGLANAAETSVATVTASPTPTPPENKKLTATLVIDTSSTLMPGSQASAGEGMSQSGYARLKINFKPAELWDVRVRGEYSQEYTYVRDDGTAGGWDFADLSVRRIVAKPSPELELAASVLTSVPVAKADIKAGLKSQLSGGFSARFKKNKWEIGASLSLTQNFHDVTVQLNGTPNIQNTLQLPMDFSYHFNDKLTATAILWPIRGVTYQGTNKDSYITSYGVSYDVTDWFSAEVGLFLGASALKSNGLQYNYVIFDQSQTTGYLDLTFSI